VGGAYIYFVESLLEVGVDVGDWGTYGLLLKDVHSLLELKELTRFLQIAHIALARDNITLLPEHSILVPIYHENLRALPLNQGRKLGDQDITNDCIARLKEISC
jgi:hypothetical protein